MKFIKFGLIIILSISISKYCYAALPDTSCCDISPSNFEKSIFCYVQNEFIKCGVPDADKLEFSSDLTTVINYLNGIDTTLRFRTLNVAANKYLDCKLYGKKHDYLSIGDQDAKNIKTMVDCISLLKKSISNALIPKDDEVLKSLLSAEFKKNKILELKDVGTFDVKSNLSAYFVSGFSITPILTNVLKTYLAVYKNFPDTANAYISLKSASELLTIQDCIDLIKKNEFKFKKKAEVDTTTGSFAKVLNEFSRIFTAVLSSEDLNKPIALRQGVSIRYDYPINSTPTYTLNGLVGLNVHSFWEYARFKAFQNLWIDLIPYYELHRDQKSTIYSYSEYYGAYIGIAKLLPKVSNLRLYGSMNFSKVHSYQTTISLNGNLQTIKDSLKSIYSPIGVYMNFGFAPHDTVFNIWKMFRYFPLIPSYEPVGAYGQLDSKRSEILSWSYLPTIGIEYNYDTPVDYKRAYLYKIDAVIYMVERVLELNSSWQWRSDFRNPPVYFQQYSFKINILNANALANLNKKNISISLSFDYMSGINPLLGLLKSNQILRTIKVGFKF